MKDEQHSGHLKVLSKELQQQFTHLEQQPPNKPSFLLVVLLSGAAIIFIFIVAWAILRWGGGAHFLNRAQRKVPTSQLILPAPPAIAPADPFLYSEISVRSLPA
jgi:hypothetical protein